MFRKRLSTLAQKPTYIRCISDFVTIHLCMLAALPIAVLSELGIGREVAASRLLQDFPRYYLGFFLPLSLMFPALFLVFGMYRKVQSDAGRWKSLITACNAGATVFLFFIIDWLVFRDQFSSRGLIFIFSALVMLAIPLTRVAKAVIVSQFPYEQEHEAP